MKVTFTDEKINALIKERKPLPAKWRGLIRPKSKCGHDEGDLELMGVAGNKFRLILRKSQKNSLDFSAILAVRVPKSGKFFRLLRYNGKSHAHTNFIEGEAFDEVFHIHTATERYQRNGAKEDSYAEATDRYDDLDSALCCLILDANLAIPPDA